MSIDAFEKRELTVLLLSMYPKPENNSGSARKMYNVEFYREKRGAYAPSPDIENYATCG